MMEKLTKILVSLFIALFFIVPTSIEAKGDSKDNPDILPTIKEGKIKIAKEGSKFSFYKILDAKYVPGQEKVYSYNINDSFKDFFDDNGYTIDDIASWDDQIPPTEIIDETSKFTTELQAYIDNNSLVATTKINCPTTGDFEAVTTNLELGYYLILETATSSEVAKVASKAMMVALPLVEDKAWNFNLKITPKDEPVNISKKIISDNDNLDRSTANIGDEINYLVTMDVPHYDASTNQKSIKYTLLDTLSNGLDFKENSEVQIRAVSSKGETILTKGQHYTINYVGKVMNINFNYQEISIYNQIEVRYTVILNSSAQIGTSANENNIVLEYTNNPKTQEVSKPNDKTETYTYGLQINKTDDTKTKLAGAKFRLLNESNDLVASYTYDENHNVILTGDSSKVTTDINGLAYFVGLAAGTYYLEEVKAPDGYILPAEKSKLVITADLENKSVIYKLDNKILIESEIKEGDTLIARVAAVNILNTKGILLPKTGGAGMWMFSLGGLGIMSMMVVLFVKVKKHKTIN